MAYIKNVDPNPGDKFIVDVGVALAQGEWAEVPDEVGTSLSHQPGWELVDEKGEAVEQPEPPKPVDGSEALPDALPGPETASPRDVVKPETDGDTKTKSHKAKSTKSEEAK